MSNTAVLSLKNAGGEWRIHGLDQAYKGELTIDNASRQILLRLFAFPSERELLVDIPVRGRVDYISGKLVNGAIVVLCDCEVGRSHQVIGGRTTLDILAKYAFWGLSDDSVHDFVFDEIQVDFGEIVGWAGLCEFKFDPDECGYVWFSKDPETFSLDDCAIDVIPFSSADYFRRFETQKVSLEQGVLFHIKPVERWPIEKYVKLIESLRALISIGVQHDVGVYSLRHGHASNRVQAGPKTWIQDYEITVPSLTRHTEGGDSSHYLFTLRDLQDSAGGLEAWFEKYELLKPTINLCLSMYQGIPIEVRFLNMVQALEAYHSRFVGKTTAEYKKCAFRLAEEERLPDEDALDYLLVDCDRNRTPSLKARLRYLTIIKNGHLFHDLGYGIEGFVDKVVSTRNYLTHYDEGKEAKAFSGVDLVLASEVLWVVVNYYILKELGFSRQYCDHMVGRMQVGLNASWQLTRQRVLASDRPNEG